MKNYAKLIAGLAAVLLIGMGPLYAASYTFGHAEQVGNDLQWFFDQTSIPSGNITAGGLVYFRYIPGAVIGAPSQYYLGTNEANFTFSAVYDDNANSYTGTFHYYDPSSGANLLSGSFTGVETFTPANGDGSAGFASSTNNGALYMYSDYVSFATATEEGASWALNFNENWIWGVDDQGSDVGTFSTNEAQLLVPEPGTLSLLGLGLVGVVIAIRRRA